MENYNNYIYQARFLLKNNWIQAIKVLEDAIAENPKAKPLLFELADIYHQRKNFKKAIDYYQKIINIDSGDTLARFKLANSYLEMDEAKLALFHYNKVKDNFPELLYNKAIASYSMLKFSEAIGHLMNLINLSPKAHSAYPFLIELLINVNNYKEAFNYIDMYETNFGLSPNIHYLKGFAYSQQNNYLAAYNEYIKAIPGFKSNYKIFHYLALAADKIGQVEKAIESFRTAINLKNDDRALVIDFIKCILNNNAWDLLIPDLPTKFNKKNTLIKVLDGVDESVIEMALKYYTRNKNSKKEIFLD